MNQSAPCKTFLKESPSKFRWWKDSLPLLLIPSPPLHYSSRPKVLQRDGAVFKLPEASEEKELHFCASSGLLCMPQVDP